MFTSLSLRTLARVALFVGVAALLLVWPVSPTATSGAQAKVAAAKKQVLFFTKSAAFEHSVIRVKDGEPSHAEKILKALGEKHGFEVTHTKDGRELGPEGLKKYDVFVLYTSGDLTTEGTDKAPPVPSKTAFLEAVRGGKGLVGIHSASDTWHSGPDAFKDDGENADPYIKALGGEFVRHGQQQTAKMYCPDDKFEGFAGGKDGITLHEEWYALKNLARDMHVLSWVATWTLKNTGSDSVYRRGPYPIAWSRMHGKGRVFYTALGHREDVWENPVFQGQLVGGIKWSARMIDADVTPTLSRVTPYYADPSPQDPPAPK